MFDVQFKENQTSLVEQNHRDILRVLLCGAGDGDSDEKEREDPNEGNLIFDQSVARNVNWFDLMNVPRDESSDQNADDEWKVDDVKSSSLRMVEGILSRMDIRDMLQSNAFFDVLTKMGPDIREETCKLEAFSQHKYADYE